MAFIQENKITINLNLKKTYTLVHFSDVHLVDINNNESKEEQEKALQNEKAWYRVRQDFATFFKEKCLDEQMIPSCKCFDNLINYAIDIKPDALLMSGDIIDYYSKANLAYLENTLKDFKIPFVIACGNHEAPVNIFDRLTNNHSVFQVLDFKEFKVIALDNSKKVISLEILNKLKEQLNDNCPILLCMHIPVLTSTNEQEMQKYDSYFIIDYKNCDEITKEFLEIIYHNENIKAIFCGHTHGASVSDFALNKKQYCASSGLIGYVNLITIK